MTVTQSADNRLAVHASGLTYEQLPYSAIECAKVFIADTASVGVAGSRVAEVKPLIEAVKGWGGSDAAAGIGVWGHGLELNASQAILLNAFQIHCQEFDCLHEGAVLHAMATLLPVLVAQIQTASQTTPISGRALITAVVAGVDIACTLGLSANQGLRFFRPATSGGFGAVAGLANLRGFDSAQTLSAFGHQLAQVSGTMQGHTEGSVILPLQVGVNARAAWQACDLTQSGFPSLQHPITGKFGYLPMFESDFSIDNILSDLGKRWRVEELSHKPFPSGRACHGGIEGLMALRAEHGFETDNIESITIEAPPLVNQLVNRPTVKNPTANYARLCMPFVLAKVLQHGQIVPTHYDQDGLEDPVTYALSQKVSMVIDDNPDPNAFVPQTVTVTLKNKQRFSKRLEQVLASPERRLDKSARIQKFNLCWSLSATGLPAAAGIMSEFERLEELDDVRPLFAQLTRA